MEMEKKHTPRSYTSSPNNESPAEPSSSSEFNLPVCLLLELMDIDDPSPTFKYVEFENELRKLGIRGILDVHRIPRMILATFGDLKWYGANHLHTYIKDRLMPLIKPGGRVDGTQKGGSMGGITKQEERSVSAGTQDVEGNEEVCKQEDLDACSDIVVEGGSHTTGLWKGKGKLLKEESEEIIMVWPSDDEDESEATLPPIAVLDNGGNISESSESFASAEA